MAKEMIDSKSLIEGFISSRVRGQGLDGRTEKAYRLDLEHFHAWAKARWAEEQKQDGISDGQTEQPQPSKQRTKERSWEDWMEDYLEYLKQEKKLSLSTICRKNRVFGYYLSYLVKQGILTDCRTLKPIKGWGTKEKETTLAQSLLSKKEADAFFAAMNQEYMQLDSEFRRRVCLRDMVMMELLFYHKIEISELLRLEVSDYDKESGSLMIRRKKGKDHRIRLFSQELQKKMEQWLERRIYFKREGEFEDRMFLSKLGKPLSMEMFIQIFNKYRKLAGIEKEFTPRNLKESSMKQYARELVMERCS